MKRVFSILAICTLMVLGNFNAHASKTDVVSENIIVNFVQDEEAAAADTNEDKGFHQVLKERFIEGGQRLWELFSYVLF